MVFSEVRVSQSSIFGVVVCSSFSVFVFHFRLTIVLTICLSRIVVLRIILVVKDQVSGNLSFAAKKSFNIRSSNSKKDR
jgi:hypothetical protein